MKCFLWLHHFFLLKLSFLNDIVFTLQARIITVPGSVLRIVSSRCKQCVTTVIGQLGIASAYIFIFSIAENFCFLSEGAPHPPVTTGHRALLVFMCLSCSYIFS